MLFKCACIIFTLLSGLNAAEQEALPGVRNIMEELGLKQILSTCDCGKPSEIPGTWNAHILVYGYPKIRGTLINNRYVLTSAKQLIGLSANDVSVVLGVHRPAGQEMKHYEPFALRGESERVMFTQQLIIHPNFTRVDSNSSLGEVVFNNLALIKLHQNVTEDSPAAIGQICLPRPDSDRSRYNKQTANVSSSNLWKELLILKESTVNRTAVRDVISPSMLYAVPPLTADCKVDDGAALVYSYPQTQTQEIIGVVSTGNERCVKDNIVVFTRITEYLSWIETETSDASRCLSIEQKKQRIVKNMKENRKKQMKNRRKFFRRGKKLPKNEMTFFELN